VFAAARRGDRLAVGVVEAEARLLALGIAAIAPVLDPEAVIIGGGIGRSGDLLVEPVERELHALSPFRPRILVSALGDEAVLEGAVATALEAGRREVFDLSAADSPAGGRRTRPRSGTRTSTTTTTMTAARAAHGGGS
jgi:N-acetylglucosamine kinase-like BadF-type ATPase